MRLDTKNLKGVINKREFDLLKDEVRGAHNALKNGKCPSPDFLGWYHLPSSTKRDYLEKIEKTAKWIRENSDAFITIGIGGSYLGSRAAIEFLAPGYRDADCKIYFSGNSIDPFALKTILDKVRDKDIAVNVISKSGTTIEPGVAFRLIKQFMQKRYDQKELKKRIIFTTTKGKGALHEMSKKYGYKSFYIPENVGGRFSVLTAVGLLPMAVAGIDIKRLMKGAQETESKLSDPDPMKNMASHYAALRNLLYRNGKNIEILCSFHTSIFFFMEWWKQLFAESEGKDGKGIFASTAIFSADLHANGQLIQQGERNIFETFLCIKKKEADMKVPSDPDNLDKLNYLSGKGMDFINRMAYKGTSLAHRDGNVPNMSITIDEHSAYCLGELIYFFQRAVGLSGLLMRINPFDQPGVQAYKDNMFRLLGRP